MFVVDDSAVIKHQFVSAVLGCEMELHVVVGAVTVSVYLFPDTVFHVRLFVGTNQFAETPVAKTKEIVKITATCKLDKFVVCKQNSVVIRVGFVNQKCPRQIVRNITQGKSEPFTTVAIDVKRLVVASVRAFAVQFCFVQGNVGFAGKFRLIFCICRVIRISQ